MPPKTLTTTKPSPPKQKAPAKPELDDQLPETLGGPPEEPMEPHDPPLPEPEDEPLEAPEAQEPQLSQAEIDAHVERINASPNLQPIDEVESLARLLCSADGDDPDNFRGGKPRWQHHEYAARQHIAAFEYLCASRGVDGENL